MTGLQARALLTVVNDEMIKVAVATQGGPRSSDRISRADLLVAGHPCRKRLGDDIPRLSGWRSRNSSHHTGSWASSSLQSVAAVKLNITARKFTKQER